MSRLNMYETQLEIMLKDGSKVIRLNVFSDNKPCSLNMYETQLMKCYEDIWMWVSTRVSHNWFINWKRLLWWRHESGGDKSR